MKTDFFESTSFDIEHRKLIHSSMPTTHYHNAYEIFYLVSGETYYFIKNKTYQVVGGILLFMDINDIHKLVNSDGRPLEKVTLLFKKDFLSDLFIEGEVFDMLLFFSSTSNAIKLTRQEQVFIEQLFHKMIREESHRDIGFREYQKTLLMEILIFLNRKVKNLQANDFSECNYLHKKLFDIVHYINNHYTERLTIDSLSKHFYMSSSYLSRIFKNTTGFTVIEYINNIRIKEASFLLKKSDLKVAEIAEQVGFGSSTHFGRVFKQTTHFSPLHYRKTFNPND